MSTIRLIAPVIKSFVIDVREIPDSLMPVTIDVKYPLPDAISTRQTLAWSSFGKTAALRGVEIGDKGEAILVAYRRSRVAESHRAAGEWEKGDDELIADLPRLAKLAKALIEEHGPIHIKGNRGVHTVFWIAGGRVLYRQAQPLSVVLSLI